METLKPITSDSQWSKDQLSIQLINSNRLQILRNRANNNTELMANDINIYH
jgi:hypothetical protein